MGYCEEASDAFGCRQTNWSLVAWPNMNVDTNSMMVRLAGAAAVG